MSAGHIDLDTFDSLLETVGGDREFLAELMVTYFDDTIPLFAAMHQASAAQDAELLRRSAHSLKSNSANFGALELARLCLEIEQAGKQGSFAGVAEQISQAETEYALVKAELETLRDG